MSAKTAVWMPLYIGDYLGATRRLSTEQHGAYVLLLMDYWRNGPPPDDDAVLARIAGLEPGAWVAHRALLAGYFSIEDGLWRHAALDAQLGEAERNQARRSQRARGAANKRWQRDAHGADSAQAGEGPSDAPEGVANEEVEAAVANEEVAGVVADALASGVGHEAPGAASSMLQAVLPACPSTSPSPSPSPSTSPSTSTATPQHAPAPSSGSMVCPAPRAPATAAAAALPAPPERLGALLALARSQGVALQRQDPRLRAWVEGGLDDAQFLQALALARERRTRQGSHQPVNVGLIHAILVDLAQRERANAVTLPPPGATRPLNPAAARQIATQTIFGACRHAPEPVVIDPLVIDLAPPAARALGG